MGMGSLMMNSHGFDPSPLFDICRRNHIIRLRLFGSFARGEASEGSDIDLIANFSAPKSLLDLVRIEMEMTEALGRKVDLLTEGGMSPYIRERIDGEVQVVYETG
jgi:hypothetical protein